MNEEANDLRSIICKFRAKQVESQANMKSIIEKSISKKLGEPNETANVGKFISP